MIRMVKSTGQKRVNQKQSRIIQSDAATCKPALQLQHHAKYKTVNSNMHVNTSNNTLHYCCTTVNQVWWAATYFGEEGWVTSKQY